MRFWDSSALVPLLATERSSAGVMAEFERDPELLVWWATPLECVSALTRLERAGSLDRQAIGQALRRLHGLCRAWREVQPVDRVRQTAIRLIRVHPLRAADSLQLGAALVAAENHPETLPFVTLDDRLAEAADREGFNLVRPDEG